MTSRVARAGRGSGTLPVWVLMVTLAAGTPLSAQRPANLEEILTAAGTYVQRYARAMSNVVIQEDYQQVVKGASTSLLMSTRADLILLDQDPFGWVAYRDVYEVDGRTVRDRDERLIRLLANPDADALTQARRIAAESARFNLNARDFVVNRTLNTPVTALLFLQPANQTRSSFRLGGTADVNGITCREISFTEQADPPLIHSTPGASTSGTFCIDPDTGEVLRTELRMEASFKDAPSQYVRARLVVTYAPGLALDVLVPATMDEIYDLRQAETITGRARYSHARQFGITTSEVIR